MQYLGTARNVGDLLDILQKQFICTGLNFKNLDFRTDYAVELYYDEDTATIVFV
jgi:hypothetical protein